MRARSSQVAVSTSAPLYGPPMNLDLYIARALASDVTNVSYIDGYIGYIGLKTPSQCCPNHQDGVHEENECHAVHSAPVLPVLHRKNDATLTDVGANPNLD